MPGTKSDASVRDRLLAAANELFYEQGIHAVGIERVLERAKVAKASLYSTFGSKDDLVGAYLEARDQRRRQRIGAALQKHSGARARILAVYDLLGETVREKNYRGCAFVNASGEGMRAQSKAKRACDVSRAWLRETFTSLSRELGATDPDQLGARLMMLYDGATVAASMDRNANAAAEARAFAEWLLKDAVPYQR
ncbi:MAG TPA: TetR/AcrR family transcriptional regulator [Polyangiaceae bacterium]|nr:TetR/AcrR family transcriptional regulator [Polyangiaceae bacterium]